MRNAYILAIAILVGSARGAGADPVMGRVLTAPTAWLPPSGAVVGTIGGTFGADNQSAGMFDVGIGLGGIASIDVGLDSDLRGCTICDPTDGDAAPLWMGRAAFRMGARQDAWFRGMPALVIGLRNTFATRGHTFGAARSTDVYVVASRSMGPIRVHAGAQATEAAYGARSAHLEPTVRPVMGFEWTPGQYPRSTLLFDVAWVPQLEPDDVRMKWMGGLGVRYQALWWGTIELGVRFREDDGLAQTTALVRLNGVFVPRSQRDRDVKKNRLAK
jgi:hypothetical protein